MHLIDRDLTVAFLKDDEIYEFYSDTGVDLFVAMAFGGKQKGTYLDIGCGNPKVDNSSLLLEKEYNWSGISVDEDVDTLKTYAGNRKSIAITADIKQCDFGNFLKKETGNFVQFFSIKNKEVNKSLELIKKFPFDRVFFGVISFRHFNNEEAKQESRSIIKNKGYMLLASSVCGIEDWYCNEKVINVDGLRSLKTDNKHFSQILFREDTKTKVQITMLPKISIITSVFKGDQFIEQFLQDITRQTIFKKKCELIIINANSPGNEDEIINKYIKKYPKNIVYKKLDTDPGVYACWNIGVKMATGEFITNANIDDRKSPSFMEEMASQLVLNSDIDLVYSQNYISTTANEMWENHTPSKIYGAFKFSLYNLVRGCMPHCMPMWRKSMHDKHGYFNEKYRSAGDWEMWLRSAFGGSKFIRLNKPLGLYYHNPLGISTNVANNSWKKQEENEICNIYLEKFKILAEQQGLIKIKRLEIDEGIIL